MASSARVSTFELIVKPIAPGTVTFVRTVIDGYFLTFSNLCYTARLGFLAVIPKWDPAFGNPADGYQNRELTVSGPPGPPAPFDPTGRANHQAIYDITGGPPVAPFFGQTATGELRYLGETNCTRIFLSDTYELCSGQTAGFRVLPNLGPVPGLLASKRLEVRGYVSIGVYGLDAPNDPAQTEFLLTPEQRGTFVPNSVTAANSPVNLADLDQINTSIPPADGPIVKLSAPHGNGLSSNVKVWAEINGVAEDLILPFDSILTKIV